MTTEATRSHPSVPASVLAIDDEVHNLDLVTRALHKDFHVLTATSGGEAVRLLASMPFSVVIADQRMPEMTGVEVLQKALAIQPQAKRLLITAFADLDAIVAAVNVGKIHYFIQKPFDPSALKLTVQQLSQLAFLEDENEELVAALRSTVAQLREKEALLARSLDERERELLRVVEELHAKNRTLEDLALRDGLTGLYNHRSFQQRLREEVARAQRQGGSLSLIIGDIDRFKRINDVHGHPVGDAVLKLVAKRLSGEPDDAPQPRKSDLVARYGGEEFAVILMDTPKEGAVIRAERLRGSFEDVALGPLGVGEISMSFGVAAFPDDALSAEELILRADDALLRAKTEGRNQVVLWARKSVEERSVRSITEVQALLSSALRKDRSVSVLSLRLTEIERLERHFGRSASKETLDKFMKIALSECDEIVPPRCMVAIAQGSNEASLNVFVRLPPDMVQVTPFYLEQLADRLAAKVELRLLFAIADQGYGLVRVVCGHASELHSPSQPIERQIQRLLASGDAQIEVASDLRRGRDKTEVQRAVLGGAIRSFLQPIFNATTEKVIGFEALARGPARTILENPVAMLDLAEDVSLVEELDLCMLQAAFTSAKALAPEHLFFVNVLPATLSNASFFKEELPRIVREAGLVSSRVVLELSERQSADQAEFTRALERIRAAGYVLGLDDLGTHNANLSEIAAFRPECIKLDRTLVRGVDTDSVKSDLIAAVTAFARRTGSKVVAEGVETKAELEAVRAIDVDYVQGFLLGKPMPPSKIGS